ncbi:hypothetical protein [Streptomyces sp. Ncost-T10-10d]|uniref:hypothetical protein n=1 Tax=Streptomyces sp. Ncost-T10-10d TaxID=1839774 RepID=UPI00081F0E4E|nr:hypothetical protein [Streptomyces sp. Ncost-T10-10d]SCF90938.1 hypothetical protein GA0115254_124320 [Streptomyces sp. Ncost-T10-10d]
MYPSDSGDDGPVVVAIEFADVVVRRVRTRYGMRSEIWLPRRGSRVLLGAGSLDCLSFQESELNTRLLARNPGR